MSNVALVIVLASLLIYCFAVGDYTRTRANTCDKTQCDLCCFPCEEHKREG